MSFLAHFFESLPSPQLPQSPPATSPTSSVQPVLPVQHQENSSHNGNERDGTSLKSNIGTNDSNPPNHPTGGNDTNSLPSSQPVKEVVVLSGNDSSCVPVAQVDQVSLNTDPTASTPIAAPVVPAASDVTTAIVPVAHPTITAVIPADSPQVIEIGDDDDDEDVEDASYYEEPDLSEDDEEFESTEETSESELSDAKEPTALVALPRSSRTARHGSFSSAALLPIDNPVKHAKKLTDETKFSIDIKLSDGTKAKTDPYTYAALEKLKEVQTFADNIVAGACSFVIYNPLAKDPGTNKGELRGEHRIDEARNQIAKTMTKNASNLAAVLNSFKLAIETCGQKNFQACRYELVKKDQQKDKRKRMKRQREESLRRLEEAQDELDLKRQRLFIL